jgi:hypothetical protein
VLGLDVLLLSVPAQGAAPPPAPVAQPSPGVAVALSAGTTFTGVGLIVTAVLADHKTSQSGQLALLGTGVALFGVGPWVGRRYGDAVTSPWRNVRLVGMATSALGLLTLSSFCFDEYDGSEGGCTVGAGLAGLGAIVWAVGTVAELGTTAADVRKAQDLRVSVSVGPVPGGATFGLSGTF